MRRQLWWLLPLTAIWLLGMWLFTLYFRTDAPRWAIAVVLVGNVVTFAISAFVGVRRPDVKIGQLFTVATAGFAASPFLLPDIVEFIPGGWVRPIAILGGALGPIALASVCWVIALFPDGRHPSPRWRWISWYLVVFLALATPASVWAFATVDLGDPELVSAVIEGPMFLGAMVALLAGLVSLWVRFRRGDRQTRAQVGWLLYAVGVYALFLIVSGPVGVQDDIVGAALDQVFYVPIPIAIAIAVLRYRLYEIDRVVSRTVSYGIVVAAMVAVYVGVISLAQVALPVEQDLAVAISTLAAVGVSVPLLRRVRAWVDRRFFRSRYDAAAVVARVAADLRSTVDLAEVRSKAEAVVEDVLAPESVRVWVSEESA